MLCLSGLDPGGGAGIQADIEAIAAAGGHALPLITALTVQDSRDVRRVEPVAAALLDEQLDCLLADCRIDAIKLGLLGSPAQLPVIAGWLERLDVPVVCDPVLRAGGGTALAGERLIELFKHDLLPLVTLATPNAAEARRLAGCAELDEAAARLLAAGCPNLLMTGGDEPRPEVLNLWYSHGRAPRRYAWPRLPETFHGAGCTLAAAIAVRLAQGLSLELAIETAQAWTQEALARAYAVGHGRRVPDRIGGRR